MDAAIGYNQLRSCAQQGLDNGVNQFHCNTNDCLCRMDIMASAIMAINATAIAGCTGNMIDATSAMGVYIVYCEANSYTKPSLAATISVPSPTGK